MIEIVIPATRLERIPTMRAPVFRCVTIVLAIAAARGQVNTARACAIDNVPSIRADGRLADLNLTLPTDSSVLHWAPFIFRPTFRVGQRITLSEDGGKLARSLPPEIVHGRWVWRFGDGGSTRGTLVAHRYRKAGTYVVTVAMPLPRGGAPFVFDAVVVRVRGR